MNKILQIKPSTVFIMYTLGCNSRCTMCDYWKNNPIRSFSSELLYNAIAELYNDNLRTVFFTGGECLTCAETLFEEIRKLHVDFPMLHFKLNTNGLLINKYAEEITEVFDTVVVSLDSLDPHVYKRIRGVDGLGQVIKGIDELRKIKPTIRISIRTLVLPENYLELGSIIEYAQEKRIDKLSFLAEDLHTENAFGGREKANLRQVSSEFVEDLERQMYVLTSKYERMFVEGRFLAEKGADLKRILSIYKGDFSFKSVCNCSTHCCVIYPDATIAPCFFIEPKGNVEKGINRVFKEEAYQCVVQEIMSGSNMICKNCVCPVIFA